jgi:hypothetical protein
MNSSEDGGIGAGSGGSRTTLERLLNAGADGILSAEEEATLAELLRSAPEARRQYLRLMQLHAQLHWEHGAAAALLIESPAARDAAAVPLARPRDSRSCLPSGRWTCRLGPARAPARFSIRPQDLDRAGAARDDGGPVADGLCSLGE